MMVLIFYFLCGKGDEAAKLWDFYAYAFQYCLTCVFDVDINPTFN
jgi:hypothetical protein